MRHDAAALLECAVKGGYSRDDGTWHCVGPLQRLCCRLEIECVSTAKGLVQCFFVSADTAAKQVGFEVCCHPCSVGERAKTIWRCSTSAA